MYRWIFYKIPGPTWVRIAVLATAASALVWILFAFVFPAVEPFVNEPTVP